MRVLSVEEQKGSDEEIMGEILKMTAVSKSEGYDETGDDENNTYAKWSPSASFEIDIRNPNLFGKFVVDQEFYVDFTLAD
ncbi:hypothetical protein ALP8811_02052 [Aliiroseovarius pelagivivens]|uniref:Uncharacterized protein n=2 Tax=Aliiroseovarius pelagivivens TaxID=1639690 RepID=A0A2R8ALZ4_9RHOB|nr:hypothetical protein ALP8811_02052 [Aliiroseovarius pelagivivens]